MSQKYGSEVLAIQSLRAKFKEMPAKALARVIFTRGFDHANNRKLADRAAGAGRTLLSIYSVIRRYDKEIAIAKAS